MAARGTGPIVGVVLGSTLMALGCGVTFWIGKPLRDEALASSSWPATDGRIVRSRLEESRKDGKTLRTADIGYDYELDGKTLSGSRVWIGDGYSASPGGEFAAAVERYPIGRQVRVHYDPQAPARSVLEPGSTWSGSVLFLIGLAMLVLGGLLLLTSLVPLLLVIVALAASVTSPWPDESRMADGGPPRPSPGGRGPPPRPDDGDDGISIH